MRRLMYLGTGVDLSVEVKAIMVLIYGFAIIIGLIITILKNLKKEKEK